MLKVLAVIGVSIGAVLPVQAQPKQPTEQAAAPQSKANAQKVMDERVAELQQSIERILQTLSGQARATEVPASTTVTTEIMRGEAIGTTVLIEKRLEAAEKSLSSIASFLASKDDKPGGKCHWVRECVYVTCCRWGAPPSDPGTAKCMEQCCGAYENRLVCD